MFTLAKALILFFIGIVGLTYFDIKYYDPFFIESKGIFGTFEAAALLYFAYTGFDIASSLSEESVNPIRDVPKATVYCVVICMSLYTMIAVSMSGMSYFDTFN